MNRAKVRWLLKAVDKEENPKVRAMLYYQILKEAEG